MKQLFAGAIMALLGLPTVAGAQTGSAEPVVINGAVLDWYFYGRSPIEGTTGWHQVGSGSVGQASNIGLMTWGLDPAATDGKPVWLQDFPIRHNLFHCNAGGVYTGDAYYTFHHGEVGWEENMDGEYGSETYIVTAYKWTWEEGYQNLKYQKLGTMNCQATDLCYDPLYDVVYGVFSTPDGNYKFGTLDLETLQITYLSREAMPMTAELRCLAINSKGQLYGIDGSGNVCKVSKTDGALTYIGNVGFKSQRRMMSATFDMRTDKLYWLGYMNNGKNTAATDGTNTTATIAEGGRDTGFYEVDTETGVATLIGKTDRSTVVYDTNGDPAGVQKERGFQLTGIYVEGSFVRKAVDQAIAMVSCPVQLRKGEMGSIVARVKNIGSTDVRGRSYKVNAYVNGQLIGTIDNSGEEVYTTDLKAGASESFTFTFTAQTAGQLKVYAEVVNDADEEARNNRTDEQTVLVLNDKVLPQVALKGEAQDRTIVLSWADPEGRIVDGAEDYAAFTYDGLGGWTMVDGDKGYTQKPNNFNESISYPNWGTPKAWIVFNPVQAGFDLAVGGEKFNPHSGNQYFAAFYTAVPDDTEAGAHQIPNNDWMISPELSGKAQTISFAARGYKGSVATGYETMTNYQEKLRVLYSTTTIDTLSFVPADTLADPFTPENTAWETYEFQLPEGAKYFALQCVSDDGFVLMVDDIAYQGKAMEVKGYKVYMNGQVVAELGPDVTTYTPARVRSVDEFYVTAVYDEGESAPSNVVGLDMLTGVTPLTVATHAETRIYDLRGRRVDSMQRPGLYIVKSAGKTYKVIRK